jgi:hypothetical protein
VVEGKLKLKDILKPGDVETLKLAIQQIVDLSSQFQKAIYMLANAALPYIKALQDNAPYFKEFIKGLEAWDTCFKKAFSETGWIMSPSTMKISAKDITGSVSAYINGDKASIDRLLVNAFSANNFSKLDEMIEGWQTNKYILPRLKIINAAVNSYKQNEHSLAIPALLAQIEGVSYEICDSLTKAANKKSAITNIKELKKRRGEAINDSHPTLISDVFIDFLDTYIYRNTEMRDKSKPHILNRHGILHGHDYDYASKENTLRCLLTLDYLTVFTDLNVREADLSISSRILPPAARENE